MTDTTTKPKRRRRVDDDAKLATGIATLAEEIKLLASRTNSYGDGYPECIARMDDVIRSMHSVNAGHAIKEGG